MRRPRADPLSSSTTTASPPTTATQQPQPPQQRSRRSQDSRASNGPDSNARFLPRYHINNFDTGGMPVSLWGMDRRDVWKTCFCFHVRTVTIFIGVWYLMIYILELSFNAALLMYEPGQDGFSSMTARPETVPTPVSKIGPEPLPFEMQIPDKLPSMDGLDHRASRLTTMKNGPLTTALDTNRKATSQGILLTVCNMLITLLMVYGAVRGKPSYLMPFFVLRVFDFCIFCLTMVNYFSYLPNVTEGIMNNHGMPFRDEFLQMDRQLLSFITLIFIVAFIAVKAYIIGVIWNCYKYLMLRNTVIRGVIAYRHDDPTNIMGLQQNLLPDLPDYETAVNDPRYAKKPPSENGPSHSTVAPSASAVGIPVGGTGNNNPASIVMPPPPPYSVAVASDPLYLVMPIAQQNNVNGADTTPANSTLVPQQQPAQQSSINNNNISKEVIDEEAPAQQPETKTIVIAPTNSRVEDSTTVVSETSEVKNAKDDSTPPSNQ